jgi:hypothetical protein
MTWPAPRSGAPRLNLRPQLDSLRPLQILHGLYRFSTASRDSLRLLQILYDAGIGSVVIGDAPEFVLIKRPTIP